MSSWFGGTLKTRKKAKITGKVNEYKRVVTDEEDHVDANGKKKLTGRQYARQTAVMLACFLLVLQGLRIYMRRQANLAKSQFEGLEDSLPSEMEWKVECGKRAAAFVKGCSPSSCARYVQRGFISTQEAKNLRALADFGMKNGGGAGGATIMDLPSGALSYGEQFIDVHQVLAKKKEEFPPKLVALYKDIVKRVQDSIMHRYELTELYPTTPRFFSKMDGSKPAKTPHDEYWHNHVDLLQYPSFEYTALVYLNDHGEEYTGGQFSFVDNSENPKNERLTTIPPAAGTLVFFTSGPENVHRVHKVQSGLRYALTVSFTCDKSQALTGKWVD